MVIVIQWSLAKGMMDYVNQKELSALSGLFPELTSVYQLRGDWSELEGRHRKFHHLISEHLRGTEFERPQRPPVGDRRPPPPRDRAIRNGERPPRKNNPPGRPPVSYALLAADRQLIVGDYPEDRDFYYQEITSDEQIIGYFAISKRHQLIKDYELEFIAQQRTFLWGIALLIMVLVILVTLPLARHFTRPIKLFMVGMHRLAQGDYKQTLDVPRKDEFAELARDYNELARTLAENESARKRWLANISHELRTPVAILRGELEAIIDGIRQLSLEQINSSHSEVLHLERLIADLHALTSADIGGMSYRKENVNLSDFLRSEANKLSSFVDDSSLSLSIEVPESPCWVFVDSTRICQLLDNLVANSVKYAVEGSQIRISLTPEDDNQQVVLTIEDDGPGVEAQHLPHLFEHLYRVDSSRNRETGGTGLGLSICSHIVSAHNGTISAHESSLGGLAIVIKLPLIQG